MSFSFSRFYTNRAKVVNRSPNLSSMWRYKEALKRITIKKNMHILDIGCGSGVLADLLDVKTRVNYLGLDLSKENVKLCKKKYPEKNFITCDVERKIPMEDNWADIVFCLEVIEHLRSPYALMEDIKRVLKKNGVMVLSAPNPYYWGNIIDNIFHVHDNEGHIQSFTWKNVEKLCEFLELELRVSYRMFDVFLPLKNLNLFPIPAPIGIFSVSKMYIISKR